MQILLIVALALAVVFWFSSITFRNLINAGVNNTLAFAINHTPTLATILVAIVIIIALPIIAGISWIAIWASIGTMALSPMAGLIIGIGGLIGLFALRWLTRPLIAIAVLAIVFGLCFPVLKGAINRYGAATQDEYATGLDNATLQKQPMGIVSGVMLEKAFIHDNNGNPTTAMANEGVEFKTVSLERRQFSNGPDTFVNIMLLNASGAYIGGGCGWVPVRTVKLGTTAKAEAEAKSIAKKEAKEKALAEIKAKAEAETRAKADAEAKTKAVELAKANAPRDRYVIPATGAPPYSEKIQAGSWNVFPRETKLREVWEDKPRTTEGAVVITKESTQCFFPPPGTKEIVLTRK